MSLHQVFFLNEAMLLLKRVVVVLETYVDNDILCTINVSLWVCPLHVHTHILFERINMMTETNVVASGKHPRD